MDMKRFLTFAILGVISGLFISCDNSAKTQTTLGSKPDSVEGVDDSTVCHSYSRADKNIDMFYISKTDTTARIRYSENEYYSNYTFLDESGKILKIKQYLRPIGIKERINEIVIFGNEGTIDSLQSTLLRAELIGDSIQLHADNQKQFSLTRVLAGEGPFDQFLWSTYSTFETHSSYITIPKSIAGKHCVFQRVETDKNGKDQEGYDIYFDLDNLLCRDITVSLICPDKN
jgi:hypothetical protein